MGKRYGRNQKKKHKAQVEELEGYLHKLKVDVHHALSEKDSLARELHRCEGILEDTYRVIKEVARNSIALPAEEWHGDPTRDSLTIAIEEKLESLLSNPDPPSYQTLKHVDVHSLRMFVRKHEHSFQTSVHLRYGKKGEWAYMTSDETLSILRGDNRLQFALEIVDRLFDGLTKHRQEGRLW